MSIPNPSIPTEESNDPDPITPGNDNTGQPPNWFRRNQRTLRIVGIGTGVGLGVGVTAVVAAPLVIAGAGFTAGGVAAGSVAAAVQSWIGSVAAGSLFASLQSAGVLGLAATTNAAIAVTAGGAAATLTAGGVALATRGNRRDQGSQTEGDDLLVDLLVDLGSPETDPGTDEMNQIPVENSTDSSTQTIVSFRN